MKFIKEISGVPAIGAPDRIETCTPELLARTAAACAELNVPVRLHCCQSVFEFATVLRLRHATPLGWLETLGLLTPRAILPHGLFLAGHPKVPVTGADDWQRLVASGASVVHCPAVFARSGEALDSFGRYRAAGINLGLGRVDGVEEAAAILDATVLNRDAGVLAKRHRPAAVHAAGWAGNDRQR